MSNVVSLKSHDAIGMVTIDSPPVNALSAAVRGGILECVQQAIADPSIQAIVLTCTGRTFIAGADITEFGKPPKKPNLDEVLTSIESSPKPVVAAIHGTALGGGLEVALACHFRVADKRLEARPAGGQTRSIARRRRHAAPSSRSGSRTSR
ncbi:Peroxisomal bifunctional enzyme (plasmid) [Bradyrhizobium guangxiense]